MDAKLAAELINAVVFMPEWEFSAEPNARFENCITVNVTYQARRSEVDQAPAYRTWIPGGARAGFVFTVDQCADADAVCRLLIEKVIMPIQLHEAREFLRLPGSLIAPFHPHRADGMRAWGTPETDVLFGLV